MNDQHITYKLYLKIVSESFLHDFTFMIKRINEKFKKLHV